MVKRISLCIDSGNTRLKVRAIEVMPDAIGKNDIAILDASAFHNNELDKFDVFMCALRKQYGAIQKAYIVSVASQEVREQLGEIVSPIPEEWLGNHENIGGLTSLYDMRQLGRDRWFGVLGIYYDHQRTKGEGANTPHSALMHVSVGTATTIDILYGNTLVGGQIFPGVALMLSSLQQGTAQLPKVEVPSHHLPDFPCTTHEAIQGGVIHAQVGAVMQSIQKIWQHYKIWPMIYVSGGARTAVMAALQQAYAIVLGEHGCVGLFIKEIDNPVLDGMAFYVSEQAIKNN